MGSFDVDQAAMEYLRLRSLLEHPRSPTPFDLVERCARCHHPRYSPAAGAPTTLGGARKPGGRCRGRRRVCSRCLEPFIAHQVVVARPCVARSPESSLAARADLVRLRRIFEPRPREWSARDWLYHRIVFFAYVLNYGTYSAIAEEGEKLGLELARPWTPETVRRAIARMRRKIEARLDASARWRAA